MPQGSWDPSPGLPAPLHQLHTPPHCTLSTRPDCVCDCARVYAHAGGKLRKQAAMLQTTPTVTPTPSPWLRPSPKPILVSNTVLCPPQDQIRRCLAGEKAGCGQLKKCQHPRACPLTETTFPFLNMAQARRGVTWFRAPWCWGADGCWGVAEPYELAMPYWEGEP